MGKSEFLTAISGMTRESVLKYLNQHCKRTKKIYPVVFILPEDKVSEEKNDDN